MMMIQKNNSSTEKKNESNNTEFNTEVEDEKSQWLKIQIVIF